MENIILEHYIYYHYIHHAFTFCYIYTQIIEIYTFKAAVHYHIYETENNTVHRVTVVSLRSSYANTNSNANEHGLGYCHRYCYHGRL